jgi:hypothetical protein
MPSMRARRVSTRPASRAHARTRADAQPAAQRGTTRATPHTSHPADSIGVKCRHKACLPSATSGQTPAAHAGCRRASEARARIQQGTLENRDTGQLSGQWDARETATPAGGGSYGRATPATTPAMGGRSVNSWTWRGTAGGAGTAGTVGNHKSLTQREIRIRALRLRSATARAERGMHRVSSPTVCDACVIGP